MTMLSSFCQRYRIIGFLGFLCRRMIDLRMTQVAASLTFTTLLALIPLLTVTLIVISAFPVFDEFAARFKLFALGMLVPEYADKVGDYISEFVRNVSNLTAVGVIMLALMAFLLMRTIEDAFNDIWSTHSGRPMLRQLLVYWMVLTLGPLLIGIAFTVWRWLHHRFGVPADWPLLAHLFSFLSAFVMTALALWLIYRLVPSRHVSAAHALIGAAFAALLIEAGRYAFGYYINEVATYRLVYGAFASLPVFLLWLYCLWLFVLAGAIVAASMSYWRGTAWRRPTDARRRFKDTVEILLRLYQAQIDGKALHLAQLREHVHAGDDQLSELLMALAKQGFITHSPDGWLLKRHAGTLKLNEVLRLFMDDRAPDSDQALDVELHPLLLPMFGALNISLETFAQNVAKREGERSRPDALPQ